jgi:hypothetical protein
VGDDDDVRQDQLPVDPPAYSGACALTWYWIT